MLTLDTLTNDDIFLLCFVAFSAVLIIPRLIRKHKIAEMVKHNYSQKQNDNLSTSQKSTKLLYTHNGLHYEVEELIVKLKDYVYKSGMKIIYPGNFQIAQTISPTSMIILGKFGVLLVRCYGFGGHIHLAKDSHEWQQDMNDKYKKIPNPLQSMDEETRLMTELLASWNYKNLNIFTASVFTRADIWLEIPRTMNVFTKEDFLKWLKTNPDFQNDRQVPIQVLTDLLTENIKSRKQQA